jgi:hypothetical protein
VVPVFEAVIRRDLHALDAVCAAVLSWHGASARVPVSP